MIYCDYYITIADLFPIFSRYKSVIYRNTVRISDYYECVWNSIGSKNINTEFNAWHSFLHLKLIHREPWLFAKMAV